MPRRTARREGYLAAQAAMTTRPDTEDHLVWLMRSKCKTNGVTPHRTSEAVKGVRDYFTDLRSQGGDHA